MTMVFREEVDGFPVVGLEDEHVRIRVVPELGAKICGLVNRQTQREWMWAPPGGAKYFRNRTGDLFPAGTKVGADECLPTVAQCRWRGDELPDHGEAWAAPWTLDETALEQNVLVTRLRLPITPFEVERSIALVPGGRVRLAYALKNLGGTAREYLWALHPMMAIEEGDWLILPQECRKVRTDATVINCDLGGRGTVISWPSPRPEMRLDRLDFGRDNAAVKFFTEPLTLGVAAIRNERTGDYVAFSCDTGELDTFGVWINRGGWDGYHHVALEPTNGAPDPLDVAVKEWRRFSVVEPGKTARWSLDISLGIGRDLEGDDFLQQFAG